MNTTSALGWALLHFLWQGILVALAARLALALLPRRNASLRYLVAVGALAAMPATVVVSLWRGVDLPAPGEVADLSLPPSFAGGATSSPGSEAPVEAREPAAVPEIERRSIAPVSASTPSASWRQRVDGALPWIVGAWVLGVVVLGLRNLASYASVRRLVRSRGEAVPAWVRATADRLANQLGIRRVVRVASTRLAHVPSVAGCLSPVLLLPPSALLGLSRAQLEAVLAHELAHVQRHDYLVNLFQTLVETLLFYHPAVWWLGARVREEREHCCDDLAVAACGSAPLYAEALLSMERLRRAPELALAISGGSLVARVERLLVPGKTAPQLSPRWIAGMSAVAIVLLVAATADLAEASKTQGREPVVAEKVRTDAGEVLVHPDPLQPLRARTEWALAEASRRGFDEFWIGHSIAAMPAFGQSFVMGRFDHIGGLVLNDGDSSITLNGGIISFGDDSDLTLPGVPLAPLVQADPADVAVLVLWSARSKGPLVRRTHVATARLPVDFEGLPVLWLGRAADRESIQDALAHAERAASKEVKKDFVGILGAHRTSELVVPELTRILASETLDSETRADSAEWLARHPVAEALAALDRAARSDRSGDVRREAAEAIGGMDYAPAFDALVRLAHELKDGDARREAIEGLGERKETGAASALLDIVDGDRDEDMQREAIEALGALPDAAGRSALAAIARSHRSSGLRCEAVETYGECAEPDDAIGFLRDIVARDPDSSVRREAVETLGELEDMRVVDILVGIVDGADDPDLQREAVETLGETVAGAAVAPTLERIARHHPQLDVQRQAVETLGDLHDKDNRVLDIVEALAADHPSEEVRAEAVETLADFCSPENAEAIFTRLLRSERSKMVRKRLKEALDELRGQDD